MAAKVVAKVTKSSRGDFQQKGKKAGNNKRTSIGKSKNSRANNKNAVRNRKGR
jgi:hypothetical protein